MKQLFSFIIILTAIVASAMEIRLPIAVTPLEGDLFKSYLWDFSCQWLIDDNAKFSIRLYGDSLIAETDNGRRFWYEVCRDSIKFTGEEDRLTSILLDKPAYVCSYPLSFGSDNINSGFELRGTGSGRRFDISGKGNLNFSSSISPGILILASGDTVSNVLAVKERRDINVTFPNDTTSAGAHLITEIYRWYEHGGISSLAPLAVQKTILSVVPVSSDTMSMSSIAYLPERCGLHERNRNTPNVIKEDFIDIESVEGALNGAVILCDGNTVVVRSEIPYSGLNVTVDIMDASGRLYVHENALSTGSVVEIGLDCSGLRSGQYIAVIGIEDLQARPKKEIVIIR